MPSQAAQIKQMAKAFDGRWAFYDFMRDESQEPVNFEHHRFVSGMGRGCQVAGLIANQRRSANTLHRNLVEERDLWQENALIETDPELINFALGFFTALETAVREVEITFNL